MVRLDGGPRRVTYSFTTLIYSYTVDLLHLSVLMIFILWLGDVKKMYIDM